MRIHPSHPRLRLLALLTPVALMAYGLPACKTPSSGEQGGATSVSLNSGTNCPGHELKILMTNCAYRFFRPGNTEPIGTSASIKQEQLIWFVNELGQSQSTDVLNRDSQGQPAELFKTLDGRTYSTLPIPSEPSGFCVAINPDVSPANYTIYSECPGTGKDEMTGSLEVSPKSGNAEEP